MCSVFEKEEQECVIILMGGKKHELDVTKQRPSIEDFRRLWSYIKEGKENQGKYLPSN